MGKKITLTESQLIRVIERVVMEQQGMSAPDPLKSSKIVALANGNLKVKAFIDEFRGKKTPQEKAQLLLDKLSTIKYFKKIIVKIQDLIRRAQKGEDVSCECVEMKNNLENSTQGQKMAGETGIEFAILIIIILLVAFVGTGSAGSCADQMGLTGR